MFEDSINPDSFQEERCVLDVHREVEHTRSDGTDDIGGWYEVEPHGHVGQYQPHQYHHTQLPTRSFDQLVFVVSDKGTRHHQAGDHTEGAEDSQADSDPIPLHQRQVFRL